MTRRRKVIYCPFTIKETYFIGTVEQQKDGSIIFRPVENIFEIGAATGLPRYMAIMIQHLNRLENLDYLPISFGASFFLEDE